MKRLPTVQCIPEGGQQLWRQITHSFKAKIVWSGGGHAVASLRPASVLQQSLAETELQPENLSGILTFIFSVWCHLPFVTA